MAKGFYVFQMNTGSWWIAPYTGTSGWNMPAEVDRPFETKAEAEAVRRRWMAKEIAPRFPDKPHW